MQGSFGRKGQVPGFAVASPPPPAQKRLEFDVSWNKGQMAAAGLFFAVCTAVLVYAMQEYDSVRLFRLFWFEGWEKDLLLAGLALATGFMTLLATVTFFRSWSEERLLVLTHDRVSGPAGFFSKRQASIPFALITGIKLHAEGKYRYVTITGRDGSKIKLNDQHFRAAGGFDEFLEALDQRLG